MYRGPQVSVPATDQSSSKSPKSKEGADETCKRNSLKKSNSHDLLPHLPNSSFFYINPTRQIPLPHKQVLPPHATTTERVHGSPWRASRASSSSPPSPPASSSSRPPRSPPTSTTAVSIPPPEPPAPFGLSRAAGSRGGVCEVGLVTSLAVARR